MEVEEEKGDRDIYNDMEPDDEERTVVYIAVCWKENEMENKC